MGLKVAIANGNWSNPSTWEGGTLPTVTDVVATNGFTVNIDQNVTVECITNLVHHPSAISPMINYELPSGIVTASGQYDTGETYAPWKAFNVDSNNQSSWIHTNGVPAGWLAYEFKIPKIINKYVLVNPYANQLSSFPKNWTFEGWDGSAWIVLHTVTNVTSYPYTGVFTNTTAYKKYRINITANNGGSYTSIDLMYMGVDGDRTTPSIAGGSLTAVPGVTITCTQGGLIGGIPTLLNLNTPGTYYLNSDIVKSSVSNTLTVTGDCSVYIVGEIRAGGGGGNTIFSNTLSRLYITGNIRGGFANGGSCVNLNLLAECYITGDVTIEQNTNTSTVITLNSSSFCQIVGSVYYRGIAGTIIIHNIAGRLTIIGPINASGLTFSGGLAVYTDYSAKSLINLFTGPFIFSAYGINPIQVSRWHYIRTFGSYMEFRNSSTFGVNSPGLVAPATRLVSPDVIADAPSPNNVRQGVSYSLGALAGTMIVPSPSNVVAGIPVDNTIGTAVLDPSSIWAVPLTSLNTSNSIGRRVKNAATVETTGAQLESLIRANE